MEYSAFNKSTDIKIETILILQNYLKIMFNFQEQRIKLYFLSIYTIKRYKIIYYSSLEFLIFFPSIARSNF